MQLNYQSIGSGGGIRQFSDKTVDFGGSDAPMTDSAIAAIQGNVLHIPTVLGAVVVTYNLPGVTQQLKFTPALIADIFLGKLTKWNDARIAAVNPGAQAPQHGHPRRAPLRRLGHDLHLDRLSLQGEPGVEGQGRQGHFGELAGRDWVARATRASPRR